MRVEFLSKRRGLTRPEAPNNDERQPRDTRTSSSSSCFQLFRPYDRLTRSRCSSLIAGRSLLLLIGPPQRSVCIGILASRSSPLEVNQRGIGKLLKNVRDHMTAAASARDPAKIARDRAISVVFCGTGRGRASHRYRRPIRAAKGVASILHQQDQRRCASG